VAAKAIGLDELVGVGRQGIIARPARRRGGAGRGEVVAPGEVEHPGPDLPGDVGDWFIREQNSALPDSGVSVRRPPAPHPAET
jgi:hypothetical protein